MKSLKFQAVKAALELVVSCISEFRCFQPRRLIKSNSEKGGNGKDLPTIG